MTWALTIISLIGVVLNIQKRPACFALWSVTNLGWAAVDFAAGLYAQAALFGCYLVLSLWGLRKWRKRDEKVRQ